MHDVEYDVEHRMDVFRQRHITGGNLTHAEIEEYVGYEFLNCPITVEDQIRCYFLKIKSGNPQKAAQFLKETDPLLENCVYTEQEVHDLSVVLARYFNGAHIRLPYTQEMRDEMAQNFLLPLKTITCVSDVPYQVWRWTGSQKVKWKAWRQGRPTILGYGMTEEEAIEDLWYFVCPDLDGTLDGLGVPVKPIIGGNMFSSRAETIQHNKERFKCT